MILEGIVTTTDPLGRCHAAVLGPHLEEGWLDRAGGLPRRLTLKPFRTAATHANLARLGEGVFHATDDALVIAKLVAGLPPPEAVPATAVRGFVLEGVCAAHEFRVVSRDLAGERGSFEAEVVASHTGRPFLGLNRGSHAVIEAAILVSRLGLIPREEIERQFVELARLVEKTGGEPERCGFALLARRLAEWPG
jgi:uncharacterized protein